MSASNFFLNGIVAFANLFSKEPDIESVHNAVDTLASMNGGSGNDRSRDNTPADATVKTSESSPGHGENNISTRTAPKSHFTPMSMWPNILRKETSTSNATEMNMARECKQAFNEDATENGFNEILTEEDALFPNGNIISTMDKSDTIGWAFLQTKQKKNKNGTITRYKKCLGVFCCPNQSCPFVSRPKVPKGRSTSSESERGYDLLCKHHKLALVPKYCTARLTIREKPQSNQVIIEHSGNHDHERPNRIHVSSRGRKTIERHMKSEPGVTPISLFVGSPAREPVWKSDPSLINIGRVREAVKQERRNNHSTIDIAAFANLTGDYPFMIESSLSNEHGCIICQTDTMRKILMESEVASETDTIESFVNDKVLPNANLTVTSSYCSLLEKWMPTQMAILFGKSEEHYAIYFKTLLEKGYKYEDFKEFDDNFMGMVCDFSDAERNGFEIAIKKVFGLSSEEFNFEKYYSYCLVHFERSASRVRRNNAVVPLQRKDDFKAQVDGLRNETKKDIFWIRVENLKKNFPKCKRWIDWYLNPKRAKIFFPAMKEEDFVGNVDNTNAQESTGRTIKEAYSSSKSPNLADVFLHLWRYAHSMDAQYLCAEQGHPFAYSRPKSPPKKSRYNDGRAADTNLALFGEVKQVHGSNKSGRKRGVPNLVPSGNSAVSLDIAIPWSFRYKTDDGTNIHATNTCALDTVLMGFYLLRQHDHRLQLTIKAVGALDEVLDKIHVGNYAEARFQWMQLCRTARPDYYLPKNQIMSTRDNNTGEEVTVWDCTASCSFQYEFVPECRGLFDYEFYESYSPCSESRALRKCGYEELYQGVHNHAERFQHTWYILVPATDLTDIQGQVLDKYYNDDIDGEKVECGTGTRAKRMELDDGQYNSDGLYDGQYGPYPNCVGDRFVNKVIVECPPILFFEKAMMGWERNEIVPRSRTVHCMNQLQHQLMVQKQRYVLVYCLLGNGAHFQGVAVMYGKYLYYDGIKSQQRLKWVSGGTHFDDGYAVCGLWYRRDGDSNELTIDRENEEVEDASDQTASNSNKKNEEVEEESDPIVSKKRPPSYSSSKKRHPSDVDELTKGNTATKKNKTTRKKVVYPMGISMQCVSRQGRQPTCQCCREVISRGDWHTVKKAKGQKENWKQTYHYHFQCFHFLTREERHQLMSLIKMGRYLDIEGQAELEGAMEKE